MSELLAIYRAPILNFVRAQGRSEADSEDLTQEVFLRITRSGFMERAAEFKGKFRTLLLAVTKRVLIDHDRLRDAKKRGGEDLKLSFDALREEDTRFDFAAKVDADDSFDKMWVQNLLQKALERYRAYCGEKGSGNYELFFDHVFRGMKQEEVAAKHGRKVQDVKNAAFTARKKLREFVEQMVRDYSLTQESYADELAYLGKFIKL